MEKKLLKEKEVSQILGIPVMTLQKWRYMRENIPYVKIGRSVFYKADDVFLFLEKHTIYPRIH